MNSIRVQPASLSSRPKRGRSTATITTEATTQAWDPHWGLFTALTVGVFVSLLRLPITGQMDGIAIEARRIAANIAKLIREDRCHLIEQRGDIASILILEPVSAAE